MNRKAFLMLATLAIIFISGCVSQKTNFEEYPEKVRLVMERYNLSEIEYYTIERRPDIERIGSQNVYIVSLWWSRNVGSLYNPNPPDIESIVFENGSIFDISGKSLLFSAKNVQDFIWNTFHIPVTNIYLISSKSFVNYNGNFGYKYTFFKYFDGDVYDISNNSLFGNLTVANTTITYGLAKENAINELRLNEKSGNLSELIDLSYTEEARLISDRAIISSNSHDIENCWVFKQEQAGFKVCYAVICLNKKTGIVCDEEWRPGDV